MKNEKVKKLLVRFRYSDGHYECREFTSRVAMEWAIHMEGDHLMESEILNQ